MRTERDMLEALKGQFEDAIREFHKPKGGQHVSPSGGDFWPVGVGLIQRYKWWLREIERILTQSPTEVEMNELKDRIESAEAQLSSLRDAAASVLHDHEEGDLSGYEARMIRLRAAASDASAHLKLYSSKDTKLGEKVEALLEHYRTAEPLPAVDLVGGNGDLKDLSRR